MTPKVPRGSKKKPAKNKSLPAWLTGMQALTWLVTGDAKLTAQTETDENKAASGAAKSEIVGGPWEWGGVSLHWLRIESGDHKVVKGALEDLVEAACAGAVEAIDSHDDRRSIPTKEWFGMTLDEDPNDFRWLAVLPKKPPARHHNIITRPLFKRDDVLKLAITIKKKACPPQTDKKNPNTDKELDAWMKRYAEEFYTKHQRPPYRDKDAVEEAKSAGFTGINRIRNAYARLPEKLKVPPRKPKKI